MITYAPWTDDATSGIASAFPYTVAVNLGGSALTVNGVAFQASALTGTNFSISGGVSTSNGRTPSITGNSLALASDFIYNGNPRTVTLKNLTPGNTVDQDAYDSGNGIRIMYPFVAGSSGTQVITITPAAGSAGTFHLCALANRLVSGRPLAATNVMGPWTTNTATGPTLKVTPDKAVPQRYYRLQAPSVMHFCQCK